LQAQYATASMRLTSRLLSTASWLIVERGYRDEDCKPSEERRQKALMDLMSDLASEGELSHFPSEFVKLVEESIAIRRRVRALVSGTPAG